MSTTDKWAESLAEQHTQQTKETVKCPYCEEGHIEYDIIKDEYQCSDCRKEISGAEYETLTHGSPKDS